VRIADACANKLGCGYIKGFELATEPGAADLAWAGLDPDRLVELSGELNEAMESALASIGGFGRG
jgi:hypothetical protein